MSQPVEDYGFRIRQVTPGDGADHCSEHDE
jgi:hypothetical protein